MGGAAEERSDVGKLLLAALDNACGGKKPVVVAHQVLISHIHARSGELERVFPAFIRQWIVIYRDD